MTRKPRSTAVLAVAAAAALVAVATPVVAHFNTDTTTTTEAAATAQSTTVAAPAASTTTPPPPTEPVAEAPSVDEEVVAEDEDFTLADDEVAEIEVDQDVYAPVPHAPEDAATAPQPVTAVQVANPLNLIGSLTHTGSFHMDGPFGVGRADFAPMAYQLPLNPPGPQATMVRWVDGWGVAPEHAQHGTLYVLGHAWAQQRLVFNGFAEKVAASVNTNGPATMVPAYGGGQVPRWQTGVLNGTRITMTGTNGVRREWIIDNAYLIRKTDSINDVELNNAHIPGRIVLIACAVGEGRDLPFNVIVTGHLA
ncbi:sortase [Corynebacterium choanae]|uniref:Sortase family protein n=1 Tax=Corynebacterium choanae TaxID=1862358 RepID=A0A3G6JBF4_9CORY|nr:sortase [Corynebacterium choanae]AZA13464.1 hypothetical protein CCHOA_05300 [Corynebacterium choanae]